jgi:hypothetical protein
MLASLRKQELLFRNVSTMDEGRLLKTFLVGRDEVVIKHQKRAHI